jgi:4-amino-4-deoxy-L-arabinose transferase-like glycosyltransferase
MSSDQLQTSDLPETATTAETSAHAQQPARWLGLSYWQWAWLLATVGVAVRVEQYLYNRSLWLDEALMAFNILSRSFHELTQQLNFHLVGPLLWLFTEKECQLLFGKREMALRLPQILMGCAGMLLLPLLARRLLSQRGVALAVGLFALSPPLIYYSSELKPYGSDAGFAVLVLLAGFWALEGRATALKIVSIGLVGAAVTWFSHPALFLLAGLGLAITWSCYERRNWARLAAFTPAFLLWAASFAANYMLELRRNNADRALHRAYPFVKLELLRFGNLEDILESVFVQQQNPTTLLLGVAILASVIGVIFFWRRNRTALLFLFTPLVIALLFSAATMYPLMGRFYLFFAPALAVLVAAGADQVLEATRSSRLPIGSVFFVLLFLQPVLSTTNYAMHPRQSEELRRVLQYVAGHQQPGDTWYVYCYARWPFTYYQQAYALTSPNVVFGSCMRANRASTRRLYYNWDFFQQDFSRLAGKRVWVIVSHHWMGDGVDEEVYAVHVLDSMGTRLDMHLEPGAVAYLYDLGKPPSPDSLR